MRGVKGVWEFISGAWLLSAGQESTVHCTVRALYSRKFALYYGLFKSLPLHYLLVNLFRKKVTLLFLNQNLRQ